MADAIEELERKRAESNARADEHRATRDRFNAEARNWAEKRAQVIDELRDKSSQAQAHRRQRDEFNEHVKEAKRLRDEWNRKLQEVSDRAQELKRSRTPRPGAVPSWKLRKDLKELEFRHMTSALTGDQEKRLIAEMQRLELQIREQDEQLRSDPEINVVLGDVTEAKKQAEENHALVGQLAESAQREHEAMVLLYEQVDDLRRQADEVQAKLLEVKGQADEEHRGHIAAIEEVRDIEKLLHAARGGRGPGGPMEPQEPAKEEDFLLRLKKGEKVSTEDLLHLQKSGHR
ncbi:MAG: phosphoserine phosphatase [Thermoplasmata archaeon]|nr:phosphoserine phosphatase [Thermoplasmata archaeon]